MQLTNAQAALAAAAQITTTELNPDKVALMYAETFKAWLDSQDRADIQEKGYGRG